MYNIRTRADEWYRATNHLMKKNEAVGRSFSVNFSLCMCNKCHWLRNTIITGLFGGALFWQLVSCNQDKP